MSSTRRISMLHNVFVGEQGRLRLRLVHGNWPFEHACLHWSIPLKATVPATPFLIPTFDRNCRETRCAFNQLKLAGRGAARNAAVRLQRPKELAILAHDACSTKRI